MSESKTKNIRPIVHTAPESNKSINNGVTLSASTRTFQLFTFHKTLKSLLDEKYKVLVIGHGQKVVRNIVDALAASEALAKCGVPPAQAVCVIKLASYYGAICPAEYTILL